MECEDTIKLIKEQILRWCMPICRKKEDAMIEKDIKWKLQNKAVK